MKLHLTHTQRLNLHALVGAQRSTSLDDLRMLWDIQDRIALSVVEKDTINYRTKQVNGMEQVLWDVDKHLPLETNALAENEFARISKILKEWQPGFLISADRLWLEPLMAQLETGKNGSQ